MPDDMSHDAPSSHARNIRLTVEYDGTRYVGWQRQSNGLSVQQVLEDALAAHLGVRVRVVGSGRTDSGVHALGQVASFRTVSQMPVRGIARGLLEHLPPDVTVTDAAEVPDAFDARRSARLRWYRFFLLNRPVAPALARAHMTHVARRLDPARMADAARVLAGTHDFAAFRSVSCTARRTSLDLWPVEIGAPGDGIIVMDFRCRSFLQNMVRILAGCIVACGEGRMATDDLRRMLETGERSRRAVTLPPQGLHLWRVYYGDEPDFPERPDGPPAGC